MFKFINIFHEWSTGFSDWFEHCWSSTHDDISNPISDSEDYNNNSVLGGISIETNSLDWDNTTINPATGLVMMGGIGGLDVAGNPYGTDLNDRFIHDSLWDNRWDI